MPIDPNLSLQGQPLKLDSPLDNFGKAMSLRQLMLQNDSAQQGLDDTSRLRGIYQQGASNPATLRDLLYKGGFPDKALALDKDVIANNKATSDISYQTAQTEKIKNELRAQISGAFLSLPPEQRQTAWPQVAQRWNSLGLSSEGAPPAPDQWNDNLLPHIEVLAKAGMTPEQLATRKDARDTADENPLALKQPATNVPGVGGPDLPGATQAAAIVKPAGGSGGMPVTSQELDPATLQPVEQQMPPTEVQGRGPNPEAADLRAQAKRQRARATPTSISLAKDLESEANRLDELDIKNRDKVAPVGGAPGVSYNKSTNTYEMDGKPVTAAEVQKIADRNRAAGATQVIQNAGPKAFLGDFGKNMADQLSAEQKGAQRAADTITTTNQMRAALDAGTFSGGGADKKVAAINLLKGLNIPVPQSWSTKLADSQAFTSFVGSQLLAHAKDLGANPSNADASRIEKIVGGIGTDPQALRQIMDFNEDMGRRAIDRFNAHYAEVKKDPNAQFGFDLTVKQPARYGKGMPAAGHVPPPTQRTSGDIYDTPKGKLRWTGTGWVQP